MMKRSRKNISGEKGAVMLETVVVLPFYLILLAGLFWLGELCMTGLSFTSGENLRLWEEGFRHSHTPAAERSLFPFLSGGNADAMVSGGSSFSFRRSGEVQTGTWGSVVTGKSSMKLRRSGWSYNVTGSALAALGVEAGAPAREEKIVNDNDRQLLKRNSFNGRYGIYTAGTGNGSLWQKEYNTPWRLGNRVIELPQTERVLPAGLYNGGSRNGNYNLWSL